MALMPSISPGNCCLLGLGGATLPHAIAPYLKHFSLVAVENNLEVIKVAKCHFKANEINSLTIVHDEASNFIKKNDTLFDYILIDLFDAKNFPISCFNNAFFIDCKRALKPEGILALNIANPEDQSEMLELIKNCFPSISLSILFKRSNNRVVLAINGASLMPIINRFSTSKAIAKLTWDECQGYLALLK